MSTKVVEEHYGPAELSARLKVSRTTVWRLVKQYQRTNGREGIGPAVMVGSSPRFAASVVNRFLERRAL